MKTTTDESETTMLVTPRFVAAKVKPCKMCDITAKGSLFTVLGYAVSNILDNMLESSKWPNKKTGRQSNHHK